MTPEVIRDAVAAQRGLAASLLDALAAAGDDPPGITRAAYGAGEDAAHALVAEAAGGLGLRVAADAACNLHATWAGADPDAPPVLVGSHLDSVPHGGNFDGAAGVVAGLVAVAALRGLGLRPHADLTVLALRCEEAPWFGLGLLGSRCALARLPPGTLELRHATTGATLAESVRARGGDPAPLAAGTPLIPRAAAYLELHIEQAPQLIEAGAPVAACLANPGNVRHPFIRITGEDAHTGLPRRFRRDAALAGAALRLALDRLWQEEEAAGRPMAATVGRFHTDAAAHGLTVVPGDFTMSLDLRAYDAAHLVALEVRLAGIEAEVATTYGVRVELGPRSAAAPGRMDPGLTAALADAAARLGLPPVRLNSPGSHDANNFAAVGIPTGMLLVRNANGSHNPAEAMELDDLLAATAVLALWLAEQACLPPA